MQSSKNGAVMVTGGSRGIGAAVARALGAHGYAVGVNYVRDRASAERVVDAIVAGGGRALAIAGDVASEDDVVAMFASADALGPLCGLVNNAGITGGLMRVDAMRAADVAAVLAINVTGTFVCAREAIRRMSTRHGGTGGAIVNLSSRAAKLGGPGEWTHYAASKGAIDTFTVGLAKELAAEGIRVNAVAPGLIETEIHATAGDPGRLERLGPSVPMQRVGTADEVAAAIVWLLSDAASYVTGTVLDVSGGR